MGWFWADRSRRPDGAPDAMNLTPPPGCPMHDTSIPMSISPKSTSPSAVPSSCPINHPSSPSPPATQPSDPPSTISKMNPLNYMFSDLSQERSTSQKYALPTNREPSSIPRGDVDSNWEYPSPQQMYNAMLRKGYDKTPEDAVEAMVAVHNFLNEGAWQEIEGWERRFSGGLSKGWGACMQGEEGYEQWTEEQGRAGAGRPKLARFMGRPGDWTPKARMLGFLGGIWPSRFPYQEPFDRHDWFVLRHTPHGEVKEVRYVIDYYSGESSLNGEEVFYLDVRPAIDTPTAAVERLMRYGGDIWYRASGAKAREMQNQAS